jgi:prepilin-type N-terminal cleavage/methylation domain-containing protein
MLTSLSSRRRAGGFSLVELMVAMAAGLIIIGAATMFAVSTMRSYSENILSSRLTQELRTGMNLVVRELRRSGHDSTSVSRVLTTSSASGFTDLDPHDDRDADEGCVTYEYDRDGDRESRGFRLVDGVLQFKTADAAFDCDDDDGWADISDPEVVNITAFQPTMVESKFCAQVAEHDTDDDGDTDTYDMAEGSVKTISLCMKGEMVSRDDIVRYVSDSVRVRAEDLEFKLGEVSNVCTIEAEDPESPTDLNDTCKGL